MDKIFVKAQKQLIFGSFFGHFGPSKPVRVFFNNRNPVLILLYGSLRQAVNQPDGPVLRSCTADEQSGRMK